MVVEHREDLADAMAPFDRMAQRVVGANLVGVATTLPQPLQIARFYQVADDPLGRPLGDAHPFGHIAQPDSRIAGNAQQSVSVVGQERPLRHGRSLVLH